MLEDYALRIYALIEYSIKLDSADWLKLASAFSVQNMEEADKKQLIETHEEAVYDIVEDIKNSKKGDPSKLREMLNGQ